MRHGGLWFVVLILVGSAYFLLRSLDKPPAPVPETKAPSLSSSPESSVPPSPPPTDETAIGMEILQDYATERSDARHDLELMDRLLGSYRTLVKGDDPLNFASNATIAESIRGKNPAHMAFLPERHRAFNEAGEIVDRWKTPLFFHVLSQDQIEIRSAGPDKQMWTDDDLQHE